jgi:hypothetical protein
VWRELGLSESAALDAVVEDGLTGVPNAPGAQNYASVSESAGDWVRRISEQLDRMDAQLEEIREARKNRGE